MTTFPIVLAAPARYLRKIGLLSDHCAKLDQSVIKVVQISERDDACFTTPFPMNRFACLQADSLRRTALQFRDQPFIWMETDSIPLVPGWARIITAEYTRLGREFMLSADCHPPHDLVGGIGVYGPRTYSLLQWHYQAGSWDLWMRNNLSHLISYSPLIQHSYGIYTKSRCIPHVFPRDLHMLRSSTVIFHRDPGQSLIELV